MRKKFTSLKLLSKGQRINGAGAARKPGLAEIYHAAGLPGLPTPDQLPNGERKMLTDRKLQKFVLDLYLPPATRRNNQEPAPKTTKVKPKLGRPPGRPM